MKRPLVIKNADACGLCNRLFPFAHLITAAAEYGWTVRHTAFHEFAPCFEGTCGTFAPTFPLPRTLGASGPSVMADRMFRFSGRICRKLGWHASVVLRDHETCDLSEPTFREAVAARRATQVAGLYFFNSRTFHTHVGLVRDYFRPVDAIRRVVTETVTRARDSSEILVGVHIRHGDYRTFCDGVMYYDFPEYAQLMRDVEALWGGRRVSFLICSNATPPLSEFDGLRVTLAPGHCVGDVYALAACDYIIGPPSTYSEWASFYGQVPRYIHRAKEYARNQQVWPGVSLNDFVVHLDGFARCAPNHPTTLRRGAGASPCSPAA